MRRTEGEWARVVARYRASGQSVRRFSSDEGVGEQSLRNWVRKLELAKAVIHRHRGSGFVEIARTTGLVPAKRMGAGAEPAAGLGLVIRLGNGVSIEVRPGTDRELLAWVLVLLGTAS